MTDWHIISAIPTREAAAEKHLKRLGEEVYLPRYSRAGRNGQARGRAKYLWGPYLALKAPISPWETVLGVFGVRGVLCLAGVDPPVPARLPAARIDSLRRQENLEGIIVSPWSRPRHFANGQMVKIKDGGSWTGHLGEVFGEDFEGCVILTLEMLGHERQVGGFRPERLEAMT